MQYNFVKAETLPKKYSVATYIIKLFYVVFFYTVPPTVTAITLSPVYTIEGKSITLNFNITDADPQVLSSNIAWVLSTTVTSEDITRSSSSHFAFSENYLELMIRHVQLPVHSGIYTLTATNEAGQASASIEVIIERVL